jgi:hypothetical protein
MAAVLILAPRGEDDRLDAHAPTPLRRVCDDRVQHLLGLHAGGKPFDDAVGLVADDRPENHASSLARLAAGIFGPWASSPTHLWARWAPHKGSPAALLFRSRAHGFAVSLRGRLTKTLTTGQFEPLAFRL